MLKKTDLVSLERFGVKSSENLIRAIQEKKKITFPRFIFALGIRNVGEETAEDLARNFGSIDELKKGSLEDFQKIKDIGPVVAKSLHDWFSQKKKYLFS